MRLLSPADGPWPGRAPRRGPPALDLILADWELGAGARGASLGPHVLAATAHRAGLPIGSGASNVARVEAPPLTTRHLVTPSLEYLDAFVPYATRLCSAVEAAQRRGRRTLVFSGDHSNAMGSIAGFRRAHAGQRVGVVWIDAHGDMHSPWTSPTGNIHGLPVAAVLGADNLMHATRPVSQRQAAAWRHLKYLGGASPLPASDFRLIDHRDLEDEEWALIDAIELPHHPAEEVQRRGIDAVTAETVTAFADYDALYVTFDVDALDAPLVPGTGCPVPGGLSLDEAEHLLWALAALPQTRVIEITEINPLLDQRNSVAERITGLLARLWPAIEGAARAPAARVGPPLSHDGLTEVA